MRQVAARAGVSLKTVSRVVNEEPNVSLDMRVRVRAAVRELGYTRNEAAASLRTGASVPRQLVVPDGCRWRVYVRLNGVNHHFSVTAETRRGAIFIAGQDAQKLGLDMREAGISVSAVRAFGGVSGARS
jgi:hypothetical protein